MKKIIFTADDYGCYDEIDNGVIEAVQSELINSVAAFSNAPDAVTRLQRLQNASDKVEIGCHLTITSGDSLTGKSSFTNSDGSFRGFTELKRKGTFNEKRKKQIQKELRAEIEAQLAVFDQANVKVRHLSSHHNSLTFFPEYLAVLLDIARERQIRLRSANITPYLKNRLFILQLQARSFDNLDVFDIQDVGDFSKRITQWVEWYKDTNKDKHPNPFPNTPNSIDGRNYGPLPFFNVKESTIRKKAEKKAKKLNKAIKKLDDNEVIEYCFHIASGSYDSDDGYGVSVGRFPAYSGVDTSYFDSRRVELESLKQLKKLNFPNLSSWDQI